MELVPLVWPKAFESPIILYEGGIRLHWDTDTLDGFGQVYFEWRPRPAIRYRFGSAAHNVSHMLGVEGKPASRVELLDLVNDVPAPPTTAEPIETESLLPDLTYWAEHDCPSQEFGSRSQPVVRAVLHLINFVHYPLPDVVDSVTQHYLGRLTLASDDWQVAIEKPPDDEGHFGELDHLGAYSFTHMAEVRRVDGRPFTIKDLQQAEDALFHVLGFARGALVGLALPTAFDADDKPVWLSWQLTSVDRWRSTINWCDWTHLRELSPLFKNWLCRTEDPFWRDVLRRSVRHCLTANALNPIDSAVVVSLSALDLLAWAVLVVDQRWLDPKDGELAAAGRTRLLLRWAGVDPVIDSRLTGLVALARRENCIDGPDVLAFVRNRIVHPPRRVPKGPPSWPSFHELVDAWRLATDYVELVILRLLDHQGHYGSRLHPEGRWPGEIERVPWATSQTS